jgi:hypothetical protein
MLYQSIGFRNVCQVSALVRTLQNHTSLDFGSMIKKVQVGIYCLAHMGYSAVFRNDLDAGIARAPRLSSILLRSPESPSHFPIPIAFKAITHPEQWITPPFTNTSATYHPASFPSQSIFQPLSWLPPRSYPHFPPSRDLAILCCSIVSPLLHG